MLCVRVWYLTGHPVEFSALQCSYRWTEAAVIVSTLGHTINTCECIDTYPQNINNGINYLALGNVQKRRRRRRRYEDDDDAQNINWHSDLSVQHAPQNVFEFNIMRHKFPKLQIASSRPIYQSVSHSVTESPFLIHAVALHCSALLPLCRLTIIV